MEVEVCNQINHSQLSVAAGDDSDTLSFIFYIFWSDSPDNSILISDYSNSRKDFNHRIKKFPFKVKVKPQKQNSVCEIHIYVSSIETDQQCI